MSLRPRRRLALSLPAGHPRLITTITDDNYERIIDCELGSLAERKAEEPLPEDSDDYNVVHENCLSRSNRPHRLPIAWFDIDLLRRTGKKPGTLLPESLARVRA
jgi:hypothetical protein